MPSRPEVERGEPRDERADAGDGDRPDDAGEQDDRDEREEHELSQGEKEARRSQGAPWPAGGSRSDGPERPPFHVPTAPGQEEDDA